MQYLYDLLKIHRTTACLTCRTYDYVLPYEANVALADAFATLGPLTYDVSKFRVILIDTPNILITGYVGRNTLKVKYITNPDTAKIELERLIAQWLTASFGMSISLSPIDNH